jgi:hypothetical protein
MVYGLNDLVPQGPTPEDLDRMLQGLRARYDRDIAELVRKTEALTRPGAEALRPVGDWVWYDFLNVHAGSDTIQSYKYISDQYEFWCVYLTGAMVSGNLNTVTMRVLDSRTGRSLSADDSLVRADLILGTPSQPLECKPPRIFGSQMTLETYNTSATNIHVVLFGILVPVDRAVGRTI